MRRDRGRRGKKRPRGAVERHLLPDRHPYPVWRSRPGDRIEKAYRADQPGGAGGARPGSDDAG